MAFNITDLDSKIKSYLETNKDEIITKTILSAHTTDFFTVQNHVMSDRALVMMNTPITFQDGSSCGFNASGTTKMTNRILDPHFVKVNLSWCPADFLNTAYASKLNMRNLNEELPFEEIITKQITDGIAKELEMLSIQGDITNGTGNLAFADGIYTIISDEITAGTITPIAKGTDSVLVRCQKVYKALPEELGSKAEIWMSIANFRNLVVELTNANMFHYTVTDDMEEQYTMTLPGTNLTIRGIQGMAGLDVILGLDPANLHYGCDSREDYADYKLWYSEDDDIVKFKSRFAVAYQIAFPDEIVVNQAVSE